jgi:ectoine hydroxylase-related dioxygenase (phytanoyl-CoA dioxygenase family)
VGDAYAAVWIALGHVTVESGPFQYVPGSHRWHTLTRDLIARHVDTTDPNWPKHTETILTPLVEKEIAERGDEVVSHLPMYGDVLIWHGRLYHRGSRAQLPGAYRPALIAHYSGIHHRPDMPMAVQHPAGGWYFPIDGHQPVR